MAQPNGAQTSSSPMVTPVSHAQTACAAMYALLVQGSLCVTLYIACAWLCV